MKNIAQDNRIISFGEMTSSVMGIDPKNAGRITKFLRDSIYSDKILAPIRETIMNALDEHLKYNVDKPVFCGIRKEADKNEFFVRDHAKGLSEQDVREVFGMYGSSSKRENNTQSGMFGIGALAPFAYSDTFFVVSHFNGVKSTYTCALGGDEDNVSVGHIYNIDTCETKESGLEIIIPIKNQDLTQFSTKIKNFVSFSPYEIVANILGMEIKPNKCVYSKKVNDFNIRLLKVEDNYANKDLVYQMGGNTYASDFFNNNGIKIKSNHRLIVDIPIGKCSITLSREGFEETQKNQKVFSEIEEILNCLSEEDISQFKTKDVLELIEDNLLNMMKCYQGDIFEAYPKSIYNEVWKFVSHVCKQTSYGDIKKYKDKSLCVIIPKNGATSYWKGKVDSYLQEQQIGAYLVEEVSNFDITQLQDKLHIVHAKKLPYPKVSKDSSRYSVYYRGNKKGVFNALEFFNYVAEKSGWNVQAKTEKEATALLKEKQENIKNKSDLEEISFGNKKSISANSYIYSSNSDCFVKKIESIGFINARSSKFSDIVTSLNKKHIEELEKNRFVSDAKKHWVSFNSRTIRVLEKPEKAKRFLEVLNKIINENSLRGKLLKNMDSSYSYRTVCLHREELRKILKIA
jgi:hypothetical protein